MTVTYNTGKAAIQWRCQSYMMYSRPAQLLGIVAVPLIFGFLNGFSRHMSNPSQGLQWALIYALCFFMLFLVISTIQIALRTSSGVRMCTTTLYPQGFLDMAPGYQKLILWKDVRQVRCHNGDVYVWTATGGSFIPREAFYNAQQAQSFADAISAARRGDFSMLLDPNQPVYAPVVTQAPPGVWPPPPM